jgi:tRNA threonylcarbamoyladenosine biosynthesis protein TsaB
MILAIDVSARLGLVSLALADGRVLTRHADRPREHLEFLGRALAGLRAEAGLKDWSALERVAVTLGPGSFTGLRVGLATAKGLVFGRETPVATLHSLAVPRVGADPSLAEEQVVCRRARADELWAARFEPASAKPAEESLVAAEELDARWPGLQRLGDAPGAAPEPDADAQLAALTRLARESDTLVRGLDLDRLQPRYLLAPSITPPVERG